MKCPLLGVGAFIRSRFARKTIACALYSARLSVDELFLSKVAIAWIGCPWFLPVVLSSRFRPYYLSPRAKRRAGRIIVSSQYNGIAPFFLSFL